MSEFLKSDQTEFYDVLIRDADGTEFTYSSGHSDDIQYARDYRDEILQNPWHADHTGHIVKRTTTVSYEVID